MIQPHTKRIKLSEFRDLFFVGADKPCLATLKNHIQAGMLSGEKLGGHWYVTVTGWGQPLHYGDKPSTIASNNTLKIPATTGNAIADRILKLATAA